MTSSCVFGFTDKMSALTSSLVLGYMDKRSKITISSFLGTITNGVHEQVHEILW